MISEEYKKEMKNLHKNRENFGRGVRIPDEVIRCIEAYDVKSILDFGCGKGTVVEKIIETYPHIKVFGYDPGHETYNTLPDKVDMIFSEDVLEHIEPDKLDETLVDLANRCGKVMYHLIACHLSKKQLSDGRNAHLIVEPPEWWEKKLEDVLGLDMYNKRVIDRVTQPKKGPEIRIIKYGVTIKK